MKLRTSQTDAKFVRQYERHHRRRHSTHGNGQLGLGNEYTWTLLLSSIFRTANARSAIFSAPIFFKGHGEVCSAIALT
jgi:hypothetical protein